MDFICSMCREPLILHGDPWAWLTGVLAALPTKNFRSPLGAWWWALCAHDGSTPSTGVVDQTRRKRADPLRRLASLLAPALRSPPAAPGAPPVRRRRSSGGVRVIQVPHSSPGLCVPRQACTRFCSRDETRDNIRFSTFAVGVRVRASARRSLHGGLP